MIEINKIYNEDCLETMAKIENESIDLILTSPPYDKLRVYDGYIFDFEKTANEIYRIIKIGGIVIWVVADQVINKSETATSFKQAIRFKEIGFNIHDTMIYAKNSYVPKTHNRYEQAFEYMFCFTRGRPKTFNPIMVECKHIGSVKSRIKSKQKEISYATRPRNEKTITKSQKIHPNIFYYDVGHNDKTTHNAPFPEKLAEEQIISWSNEGDIVYDPFIGSGTTAKIARKLNRNYIGSEISYQYYNEAIERLKKYETNG